MKDGMKLPKSYWESHRNQNEDYGNYDSYIDLHRVTLEDCISLYQCKDIRTVIADGEILGFIKEG